MPRRSSPIAVIGSHADSGVLSGGGSAQVDPPGAERTRFGGARCGFLRRRSAIRAKAPKAKVEFNDGADPVAAAALAKASEIAIVFVNQPTSEGRDVPTLTLPDKQDDLVSAVAAANPHTIVVLETGGAAAMPWIGQVSAALEVWYPGIRGAQAAANILFGDVIPSGKLPVTSPGPMPICRIRRSPASACASPIQGGRGRRLPDFDIDYTEGLKVGYKWFDAEDKSRCSRSATASATPPSPIPACKASIDSVSFTVRNTGKRAGLRSSRSTPGCRRRG
jgi:beta-glucosidase